MTVMVQYGLDINPMITDTFAARDYEEAFATAADGVAGKMILDWQTI